MPRIGAGEIAHENKARTTGGGSAPATECHPDFYFDEVPVIIKVENTLFKVHKYQLLESETFSDMFKMPKGASNEIEEGSSRERPIVLDGVTPSDFEALLKVLYTRHFSDHHPSPEAPLIVPALRLAHMWNFTALRQHLLPLAEKVLSDVDKIVLARELGVQEWLLPAYVELCQRSEPLNKAESTKLGIDSVLMIFHMREEFRPPKSSTNSIPTYRYYCSNCTPGGASHVGNSSNYCYSCSSYIAYYRITINAAGTSGQNNVDLENRVKKWVEAGCIFEQ